MTNDFTWTRPADRVLPLALALLDVDLASGVCRWRNSSGRARAGAVAGYVRQDGYGYIRLGGKQVLTHRIVWFVATGGPPPHTIDHICPHRDGTGALLNAFHNLRDGGDGVNMANRRPDDRNISGFPGVSWNDVTRRWHGQLGRKGRTVFLGAYASPLVAWVAYVAAKHAAHPGKARCDLPGMVEAARFEALRMSGLDSSTSA